MMQAVTTAVMAALMAVRAAGQGRGVERYLPTSATPGVPFAVRLTISAPPGTHVVGLEETPPPGWTTITNISGGGTYDAGNHKVKWGPFFAPSIPAQVGYEITPPANASGQACFAGVVSFDGFNEPIGGDACVLVGLGACCLPIGSCEVLTETGCITAGGEWQGVSTVCAPNPCLTRGDMNCDGEVTFADIDLFVEALAGQGAWSHPDCPWLNADINGDGDVTYADIDPFVALLGGTP